MNKVSMLVGMVFLLPLAACSGECFYGPRGGWGHMMDNGYGGMFMGLIIIIVVALAVILVVVHYIKPKSGEGIAGESPLDILKKRYAKGEITKDEFENMKRDLGA